VSKTKQADGEIHEDQLLNFLVNRLDEEVSLSLANNAEITAEDIYEVLVGACADGTLSLRSVRRARTHPLGTRSSTIFGRSSSRNGSNESLTRSCERISMNCSPNRWRSAQTSTCGPTTGDEDDTDGLYHSVAKRGTTAFHAYATLYARVKNKRTRWRYAVSKTAIPQVVSSLSSSVSSTALTPGSRPSTLIADSTTVSVSRCFRRTITRT